INELAEEEFGLDASDYRYKDDIIEAVLERQEADLQQALSDPPQPQAETEPELPEGFLRVRGNRPGRVAFWERHPDHPDGEVFIGGTSTGVVAETDSVRRAVRDGRLTILEG